MLSGGMLKLVFKVPNSERTSSSEREMFEKFRCVGKISGYISELFEFNLKFDWKDDAKQSQIFLRSLLTTPL